jgi:ribosome modulation factor
MSFWNEREDLKEAYEEGYSAYQNDYTPDHNPYNTNDQWNFFLAWNEGYYDAAFDD